MSTLAINATPKDPAANSYLTVDEADTLLSGRLYTTAWTGASSGDKVKALIWATGLLDSSMEWNGTRRTITQSLKWPRSGVRSEIDGLWYDYDTVPDILKSSTAELAMLLLQRDRTAEPDLLGLGFKEGSAGSLRIVVDAGQVLNFIPDYLLTKLKFLGEVNEVRRSGSARVVPLVRS